MHFTGIPRLFFLDGTLLAALRRAKAEAVGVTSEHLDRTSKLKSETFNNSLSFTVLLGAALPREAGEVCNIAIVTKTGDHSDTAWKCTLKLKAAATTVVSKLCTLHTWRHAGIASLHKH